MSRSGHSRRAFRHDEDMTGADRDGKTSACWLHPHVQVRVSAIQGNGLFAARPLPAGTTVATLAGRRVSDEELHRLMQTATASGQYLPHDSLIVTPVTASTDMPRTAGRAHPCDGSPIRQALPEWSRRS